MRASHQLMAFDILIDLRLLMKLEDGGHCLTLQSLSRAYGPASGLVFELSCNSAFIWVLSQLYCNANLKEAVPGPYSDHLLPLHFSHARESSTAWRIGVHHKKGPQGHRLSHPSYTSHRVTDHFTPHPKWPS